MAVKSSLTASSSSSSETRDVSESVVVPRFSGVSKFNAVVGEDVPSTSFTEGWHGFPLESCQITFSEDESIIAPRSKWPLVSPVPFPMIKLSVVEPVRFSPDFAVVVKLRPSL